MTRAARTSAAARTHAQDLNRQVSMMRVSLKCSLSCALWILLIASGCGGGDGGGADDSDAGRDAGHDAGPAPEHDAGPIAPASVCGDEVLTGRETCDDGNDEGGDGCSATCAIESGWSCPVAGVACESCGDGVLQANERCDEGDFADGMGCSDDCLRIDDNYSCGEAGEACALCGDGMVEGIEACDDANTDSNDGCLGSCLAVESGWVCPEDGGVCALCGDGVLDGVVEECDDNNFVNGDGCSDTCRTEEGAVCLEVGVLCSVCGNGFIEFTEKNDNGTPDDLTDDFYDTEDPSALEQCDDGNHDDGDGCSDCTIDEGGDLPWLCPVPGLGCGRCGDLMVQAIETCDDGVDSSSGDPVSGDGCSADCTAVEQTFLCPPEGGICVGCGNGSLDTPLEQCDDSNTLSGDGCTRLCQLEGDLPWVCPTEGAACELCGNGVTESNEACDDGNTNDDDGCAADCQSVEADYNCYFDGFACALCGDGTLQPGEQCDEGHLAEASNVTAGCVSCARTESWVCPSAGAPCELCGDGVIGNGDPASSFETCDDGNTLSSDGCSAQCQIEPGFVCNGDACSAAACGDGFIATGEQCDDGNRAAGDGCSYLCRVEPGFACEGALGCRRTRCGDGLVEGTEQCDDGGAVCSGGTSGLATCVTQDDFTACTSNGGSCAAVSSDGCSAACVLEEGFKCELPGLPCAAALCGDGLVEGTEECDVGGGNCMDAVCTPLDANGCDTSCKLKPDFKCEAGETCTGADRTLDCCLPTYCGDGVVEGSEDCDDGGALCEGTASPLDGTACLDAAAFEACATAGGACVPLADDGCDAACLVEDFYRCNAELDMPSACRPIVEYVPIRRFQVSEVNPVGIHYNPERRSFGGHKSVGSQPSIELCLDGTVIEQSPNRAGGTVTPAVGPATTLPPDCSSGMSPCYDAPLRPDDVSSTNLLDMYDATYDPVTGDFLYTYRVSQSVTLLVQLPADLDPNTKVGNNYVYRFGVQLPYVLYGITVGEDGDLYGVDPINEQIVVLPRLRSLEGNPLAPLDCSGSVDPVLADENCTSFARNFDVARTRPAASDSALDAIFTLPGESLVGIFNVYAGALPYSGTDMLTSAPIASSAYFSIYDTDAVSEPKRSALPGVLFSLGDFGTSYVNSGKAAETAADGGAFIMCVDSNNENCQLFSRVCETDGDCPSGTLCNLEGEALVGTAYCNAPGAARDDVFEAERDVYSACVSAGLENGTDCTADDTACLADGGSCVQTGTPSPEMLPVLLNDTLSESACVDPRFTILQVCDHTELDVMGNEMCVGEPDTTGTVELDPNGEVTYDAPDDGSCGFFDTFVYEVDLGGGVVDYAQVRVAVNCVCGDGIADGNEQCDDGAFNGAAGSCVENCDDMDADNDVLARCSDACLLNVLCGDGYIVAPEQCDDGDTLSGDGCSAVCTRESMCGNGIPELGEDCDHGPQGSVDCNPNCTAPTCGDGNVDTAKGEQCDDGNLRVGDGCDLSCSIEAVCGNSIVEPSEDCDDGNISGGDGCSAMCKVENVCGNDDQEGTEVCDGSDFGSCPVVGSTQIQCVNSGSGAPNICLCQNYCGDSRIGGTEECDAGLAGSASCRGATPTQGLPCTSVRCGDGVLDAGEVCDDGNTNPADACTNSCTARTSCGNGVLESGEECDDDNNISGDGCSSSCQTEALSCGDGTLDDDEQCDDDNLVSGDGCSSNCRLEGMFCGDGSIDPGEECDDGNTASSDGCSSSCRVEVQ